MKCVTFVKLLVVAILVLHACVGGVFVSSDRQNGGQQGTGALRYDRDFLLSLKAVSDPVSVPDGTIPDDLVCQSENGEKGKGQSRRKRGRRGGVRRRLRKNTTKPPLPSMILANVRSINPNSKNHNFDELQANCAFLSEFRNSCLLCFTETFLTSKVTDDRMTINGFGSPYRMDRDSAITGKGSGGGVCLYVNERWCDSRKVCVKQKKNAYS